ncbi:MAG TPA: glucokinase [Methylomirabilota bacterium]|nr:glucokinase [Methylomirabilota bacterium]
MLLAGDVGGTKTTLSLFEPAEAGPVLVREATLASRDFESLEAAIQHFLEEGGTPARIEAACVGIAGPVVDGRAVTTNLPWVVDERILSYSIPAEHVRLLNDLEATAHGIFALGEDELIPLQSGLPRRGNLAVIAAGTGLGEAIVVVEGRVRTVIATEGGHADFGPRGELEEDLLRYLRKEYGRASYERVLSGPGLVNVYRFLRDTKVAQESAETARLMAERDPAAVISDLGARQADRLCAMALTVFVSVYGAEAGNLALKALAVGGVVVAGGIAPQIMPALTAGPFVTAFRDKGRLAPLMETIPVSVALNPKTALLGAARVALSLVQ